ncbi:hypothetical protein IAT38_003734 [Cryptococcus sp. DSM 104549]
MLHRLRQAISHRHVRADNPTPKWEIDPDPAGSRLSLAAGGEELGGETMADTSGASVFARASGSYGSSLPIVTSDAGDEQQVPVHLRELAILYAADAEAGTFRSAVRELVQRELRAQWLLFRERGEGDDAGDGGAARDDEEVGWGRASGGGSESEEDEVGQDTQADWRDGIEDYGESASSAAVTSDDPPPPYTPHDLRPTPAMSHHAELGLTPSPLASEASVSEDETSGRVGHRRCSEHDSTPSSRGWAYPQPSYQTPAYRLPSFQPWGTPWPTGLGYARPESEERCREESEGRGSHPGRAFFSSASGSAHSRREPGERVSPTSAQFAFPESYAPAAWETSRSEEGGLNMEDAHPSSPSSSSSYASQDYVPHSPYALSSGPLTPPASAYSSPPLSPVSSLTFSLPLISPPPASPNLIERLIWGATLHGRW